MSTLHKEAQGKQLRLRIRIENITIALLAVFSLFLFKLTFFPFSKISQPMQVSFEMGRMVQRAFSIILFVLSLQLWKRKRNAWSVAMFIFVLNFLRGLIGMGHPMHNVLMLFDLLLFVLFFFFRKDFCCPAGRENRRQTGLLVLLAIAGVLANTGITWHYMRLGMDGNESVSISESFSQSIGTMFGMGNLVQLGLYPCRNSFRHASMDPKAGTWRSGTSACTYTFKFVQSKSMFLSGTGR